MSNATFGQASHSLTIIGQQNPSADDLRILHDGCLADLVQAIQARTVPNRDEFRKFLGLIPLEPRIMVDYTKSLAEMITAGRYDWKNDDITEKRFPVKGEGTKEFVCELVHPNRGISSENALKEIEKSGKLRPATIEELLAFGATFPEIQRQLPVVALGSSAEVRGDCGVPCLLRDDSERILDLRWFERVWGDRFRFLAVRNK